MRSYSKAKSTLFGNASVPSGNGSPNESVDHLAMNLKTKLDSGSRCDYWKSLAAPAFYEPSRLAEMAEISLRQLERYFARDFMTTPKGWLREQRMQAACALLSKAHSQRCRLHLVL